MVVGVEVASHYHQALAAHLSKKSDIVLRLVNPAAVAAIRKSQLNRRRKTGLAGRCRNLRAVDLREGFTMPARRHACGRDAAVVERTQDLVNARVALRLQALALADCLWPSLSSTSITLASALGRTYAGSTDSNNVPLHTLSPGESTMKPAPLDRPLRN